MGRGDEHCDEEWRRKIIWKKRAVGSTENDTVLWTDKLRKPS